MTGRVRVGLQLGTQPPLSAVRAALIAARVMRLDSVMVIDHFQNIFPTALWDQDFTWLAKRKPTPHDHLDYQALMGWAASRRAPVLGIGAGELLNISPYGLDYAGRTSRLEEALQVIRLCLDAGAPGPLHFTGRYFRLDGARVDLRAPKGRTPRVWVAAHGPRSLKLAGRYGDGWYPTMVASPEQYASQLGSVRDAATGAGRNPAAITAALHRFAVIGRTEAQARALLASRPIRALALVAPAAEWRAVGATHPFGDDYTGIAQFLPEQQDRATLEHAIAAVPTELLTQGPLLWGTVEQAVRRLREYQAAGLEHVVLSPLSGLVSPGAALEGLYATGAIARALRRD